MKTPKNQTSNSDDIKIKKRISFTTNTAFLLNAWFQERTTLWKKVREWLLERHENHWNKKNNSIVKITLEIPEVEE